MATFNTVASAISAIVRADNSRRSAAAFILSQGKEGVTEAAATINAYREEGKTKEARAISSAISNEYGDSIREAQTAAKRDGSDPDKAVRAVRLLMPYRIHVVDGKVCAAKSETIDARFAAKKRERAATAPTSELDTLRARVAELEAQLAERDATIAKLTTVPASRPVRKARAASLAAAA